MKKVEFMANEKTNDLKKKRDRWTMAIMSMYAISSMFVQGAWLEHRANGFSFEMLAQIMAMGVTSIIFVASKVFFVQVVSAGQKVGLMAIMIFTGFAESIGLACHSIEALNFKTLENAVLWYLTVGQPFFAGGAVVSFFYVIIALDPEDRANDAENYAKSATLIAQSHRITAKAENEAKRIREARRRHAFMMLLSRIWFYLTFGVTARYETASGRMSVRQYLKTVVHTDLRNIAEGNDIGDGYNEVTIYDVPEFEDEDDVTVTAPVTETVTMSALHQQVTALCNGNGVTAEMLQTEMGYKFPLRADIQALVAGVPYQYLQPETETKALQAVMRLLNAQSVTESVTEDDKTVITTGDGQAVTEEIDVTVTTDVTENVTADLVTQHLVTFKDAESVRNVTKLREMCNPNCNVCNGTKTKGACKTFKSRQNKALQTASVGVGERETV